MKIYRCTWPNGDVGEYRFENGICLGFFWNGVRREDLKEYVGCTEENTQEFLKTTGHILIQQ